MSADTSTTDQAPDATRVKADDVPQLLDAALALLNSGDIEGAVDKMILILQDYPEHPQTNGHLGRILLDVGQLDRAEPMLILAATASSWSDVEATRSLARLLRAQQKFDLAAKTLFQTYNATTVVRDDPTGRVFIDPALRLALSIELADALYLAGDFAQAADFFLSTAMRYTALAKEAATPTAFNLTAVWIKASTFYYPVGHRDLKRAENVFIEAVNANPNDVDLLYNLGLVLYTTGRVEQALVFFEQVLRLSRNQHVDTLAAYATALHSVRRFAQADGVYALALRAMPNHVVLLANYARLLFTLPGRLDEAVAILQRAYDLEPSHPDVLDAMREMGAEVVPNTPPGVVSSIEGA